MASIFPTGWREMSVTGAAQREIETLKSLETALAEAPYQIYHGVHWTNTEQGFSVYGDIDFIVLAPNGRLLLIEQKSGFLTETEQGLVKNYQGKPQHIANQMLRAVRALSAGFDTADEKLSIDYVLYCPDYVVKDARRAGIDATHIIDAPRKNSLAWVIQELLPLTETTPQFAKVKRFLSESLSLAPDPSAMIGCAMQMVTRLSGGLATWARRLEFSPFRLHVIGTAGSGKTQLALAEFSAALDAGKRPLYVCYNRPLADHIQQLLPEGGRIVNFHALGDQTMRAQGFTPDYGKPGIWQDMERALSQASLREEEKYDVLIVDEGQDFSQAWLDILMRMVKQDGRVIWLEDPMQNLYGQARVELPGWVRINSQSNFRSPREVVQLLSAIGRHEVEAASPFQGADIDILTYPQDNAEQLWAQTKQSITSCLAAGFARSDIVLLSFRGRGKSGLLGQDALGVHKLKSFTGNYDLFGNPVFREGDLLAESVYRFKGQSAPAVIFTEIDFEELDEINFRKLFVGLTRARLKLVLVLSERVAQLLNLKPCHAG